MNILQDKADALLAHPLSHAPTVADLRRRASQRRRRRAAVAVVGGGVGAALLLGVTGLTSGTRDISVASGPGDTPTTSPTASFTDFAAAIDPQGRLTRAFRVEWPGSLLLEPAPADTTPAVDASQALSQAGVWVQTQPQPVPAVALASVTTPSYGTPLPNGGLQPIIDRQPTWVVWYTDVDFSRMGRGPKPLPTDTVIGEVVVLVDAQTGQVLDTLAGP